METLHGQGTARVGLDPAGAQRPEAVGVLDVVVEKVAAGPLVQLDTVDVWRLFVLDELINGDQHGALFGGAVQLRLGADLDGLEGA